MPWPPERSRNAAEQAPRQAADLQPPGEKGSGYPLPRSFGEAGRGCAFLKVNSARSAGGPAGTRVSQAAPASPAVFQGKGFVTRRLRRGPPGPPPAPRPRRAPQRPPRRPAPPAAPGGAKSQKPPTLTPSPAPAPAGPPARKRNSAARPGDPPGGLSPSPRPPALGPAQAAGPSPFW